MGKMEEEVLFSADIKASVMDVRYFKPLLDIRAKMTWRHLDTIR